MKGLWGLRGAAQLAEPEFRTAGLGICTATKHKNKHLNSSHLKPLKHHSLVHSLESKELTHRSMFPLFRKRQLSKEKQEEQWQEVLKASLTLLSCEEGNVLLHVVRLHLLELRMMPPILTQGLKHIPYFQHKHLRGFYNAVSKTNSGKEPQLWPIS